MWGITDDNCLRILFNILFLYCVNHYRISSYTYITNNLSLFEQILHCRVCKTRFLCVEFLRLHGMILSPVQTLVKISAQGIKRARDIIYFLFIKHSGIKHGKVQNFHELIGSHHPPSSILEFQAWYLKLIHSESIL